MEHFSFRENVMQDEIYLFNKFQRIQYKNELEFMLWESCYRGCTQMNQATLNQASG